MRFIDDVECDLFGQMELGSKTKEFLETEIGLLLYNKSMEEVKRCAYGLLDAGADVELLRFKASTALNLINWIDAIINGGDNAAQILMTYRE
jgi:hypothetical protein